MRLGLDIASIIADGFLDGIAAMFGISPKQGPSDYQKFFEARNPITSPTAPASQGFSSNKPINEILFNNTYNITTGTDKNELITILKERDSRITEDVRRQIEIS